MVLLDLVTAAVLALVAVRLVQGTSIAVGARRQHVIALWRSVRITHVLCAIPVLTVIIVAAFAAVQVPGLDIGWWSLLGGIGNPVTGSTERTVGTTAEWLVPLVFLGLLLPALPLFAEREEQWFRLGAEHRTWLQRRQRDLTFGFMHALVGIPIGVALVLAIGGAYFTTWYLRGYRRGGPLGGLRESTAAHVAYNVTIVTIALIGFVAIALDA
jgi:hypothetical protein